MIFRDRRLVTLLLACAMSTAAFAAPTPLERQLIAHVRAEQDRAIRLLEEAVNINSGTMNFAGVRAVSSVFEPKFQALGFATRWVDGAAFGRAGHLIA